MGIWNRSRYSLGALLRVMERRAQWNVAFLGYFSAIGLKRDTIIWTGDRGGVRWKGLGVKGQSYA